MIPKTVWADHGCSDVVGLPSTPLEPLIERHRPCTITLTDQAPPRRSCLLGETAIHEEHKGLRITVVRDVGLGWPTRFPAGLIAFDDRRSRSSCKSFIINRLHFPLS